MKTGPLFIFIAVALTIGGFAGGYQFARQKTDAVAETPIPQGDFLRGARPPEKAPNKKLLY